MQVREFIGPKVPKYPTIRERHSSSSALALGDRWRLFPELLRLLQRALAAVKRLAEHAPDVLGDANVHGLREELRERECER